MSRTTNSQWHLGKSRPWPPPTPTPARRHRDTTAHPRPALLQSPGVIGATSSPSKGGNPQGKGSKGKVTGKPGKGHPSVKMRVRKRDPDTGKCIRSQKRSHKAQQKRDLRKRLHQVKQQIRSDSAVFANRSEHSDQEADESASCSREPSLECTVHCTSSDESSSSVRRKTSGFKAIEQPSRKQSVSGERAVETHPERFELCSFGCGRG